jgi:outer membrane protein assembly factor BamB/AAA+ ATPase superfamily predicted ATPase
MVLEKEQQNTSAKEHQGKELQETLRKLLSIGRRVITPEWSFHAEDWVTCLSAADIDDDGDIEIIAGSRDGYVRALNRQGVPRWETPIGSWITSLAILDQDLGEYQRSIPSGPLPYVEDKPQPRIILGTRTGQVYALDRHGDLIEWENVPEQTSSGQAIHQVAVHCKHPHEVVVGGEDHYVRLLDLSTGEELGNCQLGNRVFGVCIADVDGDNKEEILALCADKSIRILDSQRISQSSVELKERGKIKLRYRSYALAVAETVQETGIASNKPENFATQKRSFFIFSSDNGKDLRRWECQLDKSQLTFTKTKLPRGPHQQTLQSRVLTVYTADVNNDGKLEVLVGAADHFLYIFDLQGQLLWKQDFGHNIYSICACDYDDDGMAEIILGLGDNNIRALKIELNPERFELGHSSISSANGQVHDTQPSLYLQMLEIDEQLRRLNMKGLSTTSGDVLTELANNLGLLRDEEPKQRQKEFDAAKLKLNFNGHEEALAIFTRLKEQQVQHYWDAPLTKLGHIRDLGFGDVKGDPTDEIIVGTDEGELIALNINKVKTELWTPRIKTGSSVVSLSTNNPHASKDYETTLAVLEDGRISYINNDGQHIALPEHLLEEGDCVISLYVKTSSTTGVHQTEYIALGLQNQRICLYDAIQQRRRALIPTDQNVTMLYVGDVRSPQQLGILAATAGHAVVLYVQDEQDSTRYRECWRFQTEDRIRGLCAADIDGDGDIEIVIGSEDRNLYVLNHNGELKWRYFMPDAIFSVDVCDINHDGQAEILAGIDDGFVHILTSQGDPFLLIPVGDRVRVVRAKDLHPTNPQSTQDKYLWDGMVEIAVATDDRLMLFQYLSPDDIQSQIDRSWFLVRNNLDLLDLLYSYSDYRNKQSNEYVRAFALHRLAGQRLHSNPEEDFRHLRTAITKDPSSIVSQALAKAIVNLFYTSTSERETFHARQLLLQLSRKPHRQTRIAIVNVLDKLAKVDKRLAFDYLVGFQGNEDLWLRRMVIRQLYNLVSIDPKSVFSLLMNSVQQDKDLWIRQETGRSLACYFDYCLRRASHQSIPSDISADLTPSQSKMLLQAVHELLNKGIDVAITRQIAISAKEPVVKKLFASYVQFQESISTRLTESPLDNSLERLREEANFRKFQEQKKGYQRDLTTFITVLHSATQMMPLVEDMLVVYQELLNVLSVTSISDIELLERETQSEEMHAFRHFQNIDATLNRMPEVIDEVKRYRKRHALADKAATLLKAINLLMDIRLEYIAGQPNQQKLLPEDALFRIALQQWYALLQQELRTLSGPAKLSIELIPNQVQHDEIVELSFKLANRGKSAADALRISIPEDSADYEVVGSAERMLEQVSTLDTKTVSFTLKPLVENFRLHTQVIYNDAEKRDHVLRLGHSINLKPSRSEFKEIANPYHGGTPTSNSRMFYGRGEDLDSLDIALRSTTATANRIILLIGQRRSGKTSLIYQLEHRLQSHVAVRIDLQSFAMSNDAAELFSKFALKIRESMLTRGFSPPSVDELNFRENPTQTFDHYLELSVQKLGGLRLILLIDEFEVFNQLIEQKRLDQNFLHYLRSLMQHRLGVNFLLAGAPRVLLIDLNNRSALLNIAQKHHLTRLKDEEATKLITEPVQNLTYDPSALELIHQLTGDQPYLIHLLCEELIRFCNKSHKNYANANDVNKIIETVLERGDNYFGMIWNLATTLEERLVFAFLAREEQSKIFSLADLKRAFSDANYPYNAESVRQALNHLKEEEIIEGDNDGQLFSIPIDLTCRWLRQHTTVDRIIRGDEFKTGES